MVMKENNEAEASQAALIILNAVKTLEVGKLKLAAFLKGSKAKDIQPITNKAIYGGLFWYTIPTITKCIEQLETMGLIQRKMVSGYPYPYTVLTLTDDGKQAIEEKKRILLQIIKEPEPIVVGNSEKVTYELLKQGKTVAEIARERNIVLSTVYTHMFRLIVNKYLTSAEVIQPEVIRKVREVAQTLQKPTVKQVKELLPEISYEEIRCVLADKRNS